MPKEIDIRKIKKDPVAGNKTMVVGNGFGMVEKPKIPAKIVDSGSPVTQSFISRFLDIMVCDIMQKLRRPLPARLDNLTKKAEDFEKFEQFCELARGEKR